MNKSKVLFVFAVASVIQSAHALNLITDQDLVWSLPGKTPFTWKADVFVKPRQLLSYIQAGTTFETSAQLDFKKAYCSIGFVPSDQERYIPAGKSLQLLEIERYSSGITFKLEKFSMWCWSPTMQSTDMSIGELKQILNGIVEIGPYPAPIEFP